MPENAVVHDEVLATLRRCGATESYVEGVKVVTDGGNPVVVFPKTSLYEDRHATFWAEKAITQLWKRSYSVKEIYGVLTPDKRMMVVLE